MFERFIEFIPSLYCWHNLVIKPRFYLDLHSDPFWWSYEIYCSCKSIYKIWVSIIYTSIGRIVWENDLSYNVQKFSAECYFIERIYVYGIWVRISFLCSKSGRDQTDQDLWRLIEIVFANLFLKISLSLGCKFILISPRR